MPTIIGVCGSLRAASYNAMLLRAAAELTPPDTTLEIASIREIPLYDGDLEEREGVPAAVEALKARIAASEGLLIATPEYNNSVPGVLKNAIDWLSRPPSDIARVFGGLPVGIIGATPGVNGTNLAQAAWLPVFRTLRTSPFFGGRVAVAGAAKVFAQDGRLTDEKVREQLRTFLAGFTAFAARQARAR